jgi:uncharacterized protein (DUF302 family)
MHCGKTPSAEAAIMPVSQVDGSLKASRGLSPVARIVSDPLASTALTVVGTTSPSFAVVLNCSSIGGASTEDAVRLESPYSFSDTLTRLQSTLESKDFRIFVAIDHRAAARSVGLRLPPTTVLVYGNPKGGTTLMLAAPDFALELPLRVLVREDQQGRVYVTYNPSTTLEGKHGLPGGMAERLASAETVIADALAAPTGQN